MTGKKEKLLFLCLFSLPKFAQVLSVTPAALSIFPDGNHGSGLVAEARRGLRAVYLCMCRLMGRVRAVSSFPHSFFAPTARRSLHSRLAFRHCNLLTSCPSRVPEESDQQVCMCV